MDTIETAAPRRTGPTGPRPAGPWHLLWSRLSWPFVALWRKGRNRWLLDRGIRRPRRWWRPRTWPETAIYTLLSGVYLLWILRSIWPGGPWGFLKPAEKWLSEQQLTGALTALGLSSATVMAAVWFLGWRFQRARRLYLRKAKNDAADLVKPGSIIGEVVGRDQLCDALMSDLRDCRRRRPHVIEGSIGVGKTALLVRLTEQLARKGAIPVVLQLQDVKDADGELDFSELAKRRFVDQVREWVSQAEAEKVWQRLRYRNDSVVVLADGLEDALKDEPDRANKIRIAIAEADDAKLPLVIASRPQESLLAVRAARTVLEPLSEEAALRYITANSGWRSDRQRLDWVVEAANVAESPLYLNVAKDLESRSLLEPIVGGGGDKLTDPRDYDEWALRYDLLEAWIQALIDGHLYPEQPLSYYGRFMTVEYLSALACAGLRDNSTRVAYKALAAPERTEQEETEEDRSNKAFGELLLKELRTRGEREGVKGKGVIGMRLAGSWGSRLGLVEEQGDGVKFHHSVLQAYLASRYLHTLVKSRLAEADPGKGIASQYFNQALTHPGRELDMALVFYSRSPDALSGCKSGNQSASTEDGCPIGVVRHILRDKANEVLKSLEKSDRSDPGRTADDDQDLRIRALEMYSAALDIDSFHHQPEHRNIVTEIRSNWKQVQEYNARKLDPTKKALIQRIGAAARLISGRNTFPPASAAETRAAYDYMFDMACVERSHAVRFTIAQEIGEGGDDAFHAVRDRLQPGTDDAGQFALAVGITQRESVGDVYCSLQGDLRLTVSRTAPGSSSRLDSTPPVSAPGTTRTERLLRKERKQRLRGERQKQEKAEQEERDQDEQRRHAKTMQAWLAPMLVRSCTLTHHHGTPYELVSQWAERMKNGELDRGLQVALAQGFKQAANHRIHPTEPTAARDFLSEQAWEMLKQTSYWFARLTLVHALTLWALPDDVGQRQPRYGHGSHPREQVRRWLERPGIDGRKHTVREEHPLVRAAGKLARQALQTRHPDRFLWIDEAGVAGQIGSETSSPHEPRLHNLWVPPSTGWSTLDPAAQQLLADVLVLLILSEERGDRVEDELLRLRRVDRPAPPLLPHCLIKDRSPLEPMLALVREAPRSLPGSNCADGCPFELCPYPPKGPECRTELSELFCIHQRNMLNVLQLQAWRFFKFRRRAPWQRHVPVANLRRFWDQMGARARDRTPEEAFRRPRIYR